MEARRERTVGRRQPPVAGTERQPVGLADRRARDDLRRHEERVHHSADEDELLPVLFAEVGPFGPRQVEQLQHDRQHAIEVPRPLGAFQGGRDLGFGDAVPVPIGVEVAVAWHDHEISPCRAQRREVCLQDTWVVRQVRAVVELRRVDEDADQRQIVLRAAPLDQRQMPGVQRPHRRHEAQRLPSLRLLPPLEPPCGHTLEDRGHG